MELLFLSALSSLMEDVCSVQEEFGVSERDWVLEPGESVISEAMMCELR